MASTLTNRILHELPLFIRRSPYTILIPNFYVGRYEMDMFMMNTNGYISEYEVKITKQDFKADFDKPWKHSLMESGDCAPNKFWYVMPFGMVKHDEVPKYAGIIWVSDYGRSLSFQVGRNANFLHKRTGCIDYKEIAQRLAFRESNLRKKLLLRR